MATRAGRRALLLAAATALLAASCSSEPPEPLVVTKAFTGEKVVASLRVVDGDGTVLGDDYRPFLQYVPERILRPQGPLASADGVLRQAFELRPKLRGAPLRVKRRWKAKGESTWRELPPVTARSATGQLVVDFPADGTPDPAAAEVHAMAALAPPAERTERFRDLEVVPGTVLVGGYGLYPETAAVTTGPVEFRLTVRGAGGEQPLLEAVRDPRATDAETWSDYRFDLTALAGQKVDVELRTRVQPATAGDTRVGFPVWSVPRMLAPRTQGESRDERPDGTLNVVLISLDTLRADFVGAYGHDQPTTPNIDRFAREGTLFERAMTTYPSTTASHMSMLTGLLPQVHGVYGPGERIAPQVRTLAELLAAQGYQTGAVTEDAMINAHGGFLNGFGEYREYNGEPTRTGYVEGVMTSGIEFVTRHRDQRFFLFLHTYQVHDPYTPPAEYDVFRTYVEDGTERTVGDDTPPLVRSRLGYEGDLLYTDEEVARFLAALDDLGLADRTLVIITADHGEALGEHGLVGHGWFMLEPVLHVPLIVRAPGRVPAGRRVGALASLADLPPTILELVGAPPGPPMQGASLVPLLDDPDDERFRDRTLYAEKRGKDWILIARRGETKWEVRPSGVKRYDLASDPEEKSPAAADDDPAIGGAGFAERYRADNDAFRARLGSASAPASVPVDDSVRSKLRALGYTE